MIAKTLLNKPDIIGSMASSLCLVHCIITPFIFISQACTKSCCADAPVWWQSIDYIFIVISFFAIYRSAQTSSSKLIKKTLWITWFTFLCLILNKTIGIIYINPNFVYFTGISLAILHLYNLKYCQCKSEKCCIKTVS